jgi:hypothetical protein
MNVYVYVFVLFSLFNVYMQAYVLQWYFTAIKAHTSLPYVSKYCNKKRAFLLGLLLTDVNLCILFA